MLAFHHFTTSNIKDMRLFCIVPFLLVLAWHLICPAECSHGDEQWLKEVKIIQTWDGLVQQVHNVTSLTLFQKIRLQFSMKRIAKAVETIRMVTPSQNTSASQAILTIKLDLGQYEEVLDLFHQAPQRYAKFFVLFCLCLTSGAITPCSNSWKSVGFAAIHQRAQEGYLKLQHIDQSFKSKHWRDALQDIDDFLSGSNLFTNLILKRAWCSYHLGDYLSSTFTLLDHVYPFHPQHLDTIHLLGLSYYQLGQLQHATHFFEMCLHLIHDHHDCSQYYLKASKLLDFHRRLRIAMEFQSFPLSMAYLQEILAVAALDNPAVAWYAQKQLVKLYIHRQSISEAQKILKTMIQKHLEDPEIYLMQGQVYEVVHDFEQARQAYGQALILAQKNTTQTIWVDPIAELDRNVTSSLSSHLLLARPVKHSLTAWIQRLTQSIGLSTAIRPSVITGETVLHAIHQAMESLEQKESAWQAGHSYFEILSVPRDASVEEIKRAHWEQSNYWNPHLRTVRADQVKAEKMFMLIMEARSVLMDDPNKRSATSPQ